MLPARSRKEDAGGAIGVKNGQIEAARYAGAAKLTEDIVHHLVVGGELIVQPDILDRQPNLLEQMKDELQFGIGQWLARDPAVKGRYPEKHFAVEDRDRYL